VKDLDVTPLPSKPEALDPLRSVPSNTPNPAVFGMPAYKTGSGSASANST